MPSIGSAAFRGHYFTAVIKIAVTGPESSGKTTLVEALAHHYGCAWTQEYARTYLAKNGPAYVEEDLLRIADGQRTLEVEAERSLMGAERQLLICDTDMLTVRIWSAEKFDQVHPLLERAVRDVRYDHLLLCRPDIPWEPDELRENPHDRDRLFKVYEEALRTLRRPCTIIEGDRQKRFGTARSVIDVLLREDEAR